MENKSVTDNEKKIKEIYHKSSKNVSSDSSSELLSDKMYVKENLNSPDLPHSAVTYEDENGQEITVAVEDLMPSQSSPYFNIRLVGNDGQNYPLTDEESAERTDLYEELSAIKLIENPRGASIYSPYDFLYVKDYDVMKLNRLITLRRFAHPCLDDIFSKTTQTEPDICRLLAYSDQTKNKISDMGFDFGLKWKPLDSKSEQAHMEGNQNGVSGIAGAVLRFVDPKFGEEEMMGRNRMNYDPQHDQNRVYGMVDSIASTHIRDIGVKFEQPINLVFEFEMRSHNGINQKSAFIDLLSNLILMCTNDAKFWGGARYWVGARPSRYMKNLKALESKNWQEFVSKSMVGMKSFMKQFETKGSAYEMLKNIANNAMNLALGKLLNVLGRSSIPAMNSLLSPNPVGLWHLTIGNPMNPIMCMGDLIMENARISFNDELGYDDFPTEIKLEVVLKHAKPRGRAEIENMFNCGKGRIYLKPKDVMKHNVQQSTKQKPNTLSNSKGNNKKFGEYTYADVERNGRELWSFLTDKG